MFSSLTMLVTFVVFGAPVGAIGIPWALLTGDIDPLYRWSMWILRAGVRLARIRVQVVGREDIPARPCIFMANHVSNLDPPILLPCSVPHRSSLLSGRCSRFPSWGWVCVWPALFRWTAAGRLESARESVEAANRVLASGVNISTFPEGTRSRNGRLLPFKKGPFTWPWSRAPR